MSANSNRRDAKVFLLRTLTLKTWMLSKETKKENGIFQVFDMEKFFDKESLLDAMYTLSTRAKVCDKTYRLWYKLNDKARISVKTTVGESDNEVMLIVWAKECLERLLYPL